MFPEVRVHEWSMSPITAASLVTSMLYWSVCVKRTELK